MANGMEALTETERHNESFHRIACAPGELHVPLRANIRETSLVPLINEQGEKE